MGLFSFLTQEIAIDLGTANTIIIQNDKIVVDEPSIVAIDLKTEKTVAIGEKARQMQGKTHAKLKTIAPLEFFLRYGKRRGVPLWSICITVLVNSC